MKKMIMKAAQAMVVSLFFATSVQAEIVVIGHPSISDTLSVSQVKRIFLAKEDKLPSGSPVEVVDITNGVAIRDDFYKKVAKKSPHQLQAYRAKMLFSGNGTSPIELDSTSKIKAWVAEKPGRLGYIDRADLDDSVKVISVIK